MPLTQFWIRAIWPRAAAAMTRGGFLDGKASESRRQIGGDAGLHFRRFGEALGGDQIDLPAEQALKRFLRPREAQQRHGPFRGAGDDEVNVAVGAGFIARHGAEQGQMGDADRLKLVRMGAQNRKHVSLTHAVR